VIKSLNTNKHCNITTFANSIIIPGKLLYAYDKTLLGETLVKADRTTVMFAGKGNKNYIIEKYTICLMTKALYNWIVP